MSLIFMYVCLVCLAAVSSENCASRSQPDCTTVSESIWNQLSDENLKRTTAGSVSISEGFDSIGTLGGSGWVVVQESNPAGSGIFQGSTGVFTGQSGGYVGMNYAATSAGGGTISLWLMSPEINFNTPGVSISFYTRTVPTVSFPDRLYLKYSLAGSSTATANFNTTLVSVNPDLLGGNNGYPTSWTQFTATVPAQVSGPTGRIAWHYSVPNAGDGGANSDYIGIDTVEITSAVVSPTPSPTPSITPTSSVTPTASVTPTVTPTPSVTPSRTPSPSSSVTPSPSVTPTASVTPTSSVTPTPSTSPSTSPSITPVYIQGTIMRLTLDVLDEETLDKSVLECNIAAILELPCQSDFLEFSYYRKDGEELICDIKLTSSNSDDLMDTLEQAAKENPESITDGTSTQLKSAVVIRKVKKDDSGLSDGELAAVIVVPTVVALLCILIAIFIIIRKKSSKKTTTLLSPEDPKDSNPPKPRQLAPVK